MTSGADQQAYCEAIDAALALLEAHGRAGTPLLPAPDAAADTMPSTPLSGLLEQYHQLIAKAFEPPMPPLRLVHHMACTGGTLIARCIAALPNTRVLSEVDPLSELGYPKNRFFPSDLIGLAKFGTRPPDRMVLAEIFLAGLAVLHDDSRRHGLDMVLRDHAHSQFCHGPKLCDRPTLREILAEAYTTCSVVTLRHPLDSFLALRENGWLHFTQATVEEYARRYHAFLDRHADLLWLRYEDFLDDPEAVMQRICAALDLAYDPAFRELFVTVQLSGDSGRSSPILTKRPRRRCPDALLDEVQASPAFGKLLGRMGYGLEH